jgi:hypothetical protein
MRRDVLIPFDEADLIPGVYLRSVGLWNRGHEEKHEQTTDTTHDGLPSGNPYLWPVCRLKVHAGLRLPLVGLETTVPTSGAHLTS